VGQLVQALDIAGAPQELRSRQRIVDLKAASEVEPLGYLTEVRRGEVAREDVADGGADDVALPNGAQKTTFSDDC